MTPHAGIRAAPAKFDLAANRAGIHLKHIFEKTGFRGRYGPALSGLKEKGMLAATVERPN